MRLTFDENLANAYKSPSQKARVMTEAWVGESIFCPGCGKGQVEQYDNNKPVADFYCSICGEDFELKAKRNPVGKKVVDGAYKTMMERLSDDRVPNLFLMGYDWDRLEVRNFFVVPGYFFVPSIIEERKPLSPFARRAGWVGCNIALDKVPNAGKIFLVKDGTVAPKEQVRAQWDKTAILREEKSGENRGWLLDVLRCVERLGKREFTLDEVYTFEKHLGELHPQNSHIKAKIRQQLQLLRDKGFVEFSKSERGCYVLVASP